MAINGFQKTSIQGSPGKCGDHRKFYCFGLSLKYDNLIKVNERGRFWLKKIINGRFSVKNFIEYTPPPPLLSLHARHPFHMEVRWLSCNQALRFVREPLASMPQITKAPVHEAG